jgi:predicted MFS family arabinose efflux permease
MAVIMGAFSLASVVGVPLGMWLATQFSWHVPFGSVVGIGLINLVLIYKYLPSLTSHISVSLVKPSPLSVLTNISKDSNQLLGLSLSAIVIFGHFITIPSLSTFLTQNLKMPEKQLSLIYLIGGGLTIFSSRIVGRLADKKGKFKVFAISAVLFLIPILVLSRLESGVAVWLILMITTLFFLFANGRTIPMQALVSGVVNNKNRGGFTSINQSVIQLSSGFSSFVAGLIVTEGPDKKLIHYSHLGYVTIVTMLMGIWIASKIKPVKDQ